MLDRDRVLLADIAHVGAVPDLDLARFGRGGADLGAARFLHLAENPVEDARTARPRAARRACARSRAAGRRPACRTPRSARVRSARSRAGSAARARPAPRAAAPRRHRTPSGSRARRGRARWSRASPRSPSTSTAMRTMPSAASSIAEPERRGDALRNRAPRAVGVETHVAAEEAARPRAGRAPGSHRLPSARSPPSA